MAGVQSIERAFALLRTLSISPGGVTELADRIQLPKSTVARLLSALEQEGAVEQTESGGEYRIGDGLGALAADSSTEPDLNELAMPFLISLAEETGESSGLDTLRDGWVHFIDHVNDDRDVQVRDWTGEAGPAHSLPSGIVLLAHADQATIERYLDSDLDNVTPTTIVDPDQLRERMAQAISAGYSWGFEEFAEGINSVAAPVFAETGVVAALRVHGPTFRFPNPNFTHDIGLIVADAARRLTGQLLAGAPPS